MKLNEVYDEYLLKKTAREGAKDFKRYTNKVLKKVAQEKSLNPRKVRKIVEKEKMQFTSLPAIVDTCLITAPISNYASQETEVRKSKELTEQRTKINTFAKNADLDLKKPQEVIDASYAILSRERAGMVEAPKQEGMFSPAGFTRMVPGKKTEATAPKDFSSFLNQITPDRPRIMQQALRHANAQLSRYKKDFSGNVMGKYLQYINEGRSKRDAVLLTATDLELQTTTQAIRFMETEIHGVYEESKIRNALAAGYKYKYWRTARDVRVRDSHRRLDGRIVKHDEMFNVGSGKGLYPGDPNLPLEELIGCRCSTEFSFVPRGTRKGPNVPLREIPKEIGPRIVPIPLTNSAAWEKMIRSRDGTDWDYRPPGYMQKGLRGEFTGESQNTKMEMYKRRFDRANQDQQVADLMSYIPGIKKEAGASRRVARKLGESVASTDPDNLAFYTKYVDEFAEHIDRPEGFNIKGDFSDLHSIDIYSGDVTTYQGFFGQAQGQGHMFLGVDGDYAMHPKITHRIATHEKMHMLDAVSMRLIGRFRSVSLGSTGRGLRNEDTYNINASKLASTIREQSWYDPGMELPFSDKDDTIERTKKRRFLERMVGQEYSEELPTYGDRRGTVEGDAILQFFHSGQKINREKTRLRERYNKVDFDIARAYGSERPSRGEVGRTVLPEAFRELKEEITNVVGEDLFNDIEQANIPYQEHQKNLRNTFQKVQADVGMGRMTAGEGNALFQKQREKLEKEHSQRINDTYINGVHIEDLRTTGSFLDAVWGGELQDVFKVSGHGRAYHNRTGASESEMFANYMTVKSNNPELANRLRNTFPEIVGGIEEIGDTMINLFEHNAQKRGW